MLMQSETRRDMIGPGGCIVPPRTVFICDDMGLALELAEAKLAHPLKPVIVRRNVAAPPTMQAVQDKPNWPDVFVLGITADGRGGGERSLKRLTECLENEGYWTMLGGWDTLCPPGRTMGLPYPKAIIVQCSAGPTLTDKLRQRFPGSVLIQYVQNVAAVHVAFHKYAHVLCNSYFSEARVKEMGAERTSVQMPPLDDSWAKVKEHNPEYVLSIYMTPHKGGAIIQSLAKAMPDVQFAAIDNRGRPEQGETNLKVLGWRLDMRPVYSGAKVFLAPARCEEAFCRTVAEAIGNGIPCVVSDRGNLPWFAEQRPDLVEVVAGEKTDVWKAALERALAKGIGEPWEDAWKIGAQPTAELLSETFNVKPGERRPAIALEQRAGVGDALMTLPFVVAKSRTHDVYIAPSVTGPVREIFEMCPHFRPDKPGLNVPLEHIPPFMPTETLAVKKFEPRQKSIARRGGARLSRYQPLLSFDAEVIEYVKMRLPKHEGRRMVAVSLTSHNTGHNVMPDKYQQKIIALLAEKYTVVLMHDKPQPRLAEAEHVHDCGGLFKVKEALHAMTYFDAMVAVDGGGAHMAGATMTPLVAILGMVGRGFHISYSDAYGGRVAELSKNLDCQPCWAAQPKKCDIGCLQWEAEPVLEALEEVML